MKVTLGFVTNSRSSCYICYICGADESGWDMSLSDAYMVQCINGHTFCEHHLNDEFKKPDEDWRYEIKESDCPICSFKVGKSEDMLIYLLYKYSLKKDDVLKDISNQFESYADFRKFIKDRK